jgi:isoleucyl-tRNA synthetase
MTMLSVFLPFTMEEVYQKYFNISRNEDDSIHLQKWAVSDKKWNNEALMVKFEELLKVREAVLKAVEVLRSGEPGGENIGSSLEARVLIMPLNKHYSELLGEFRDSLRYLFIVSDAVITDNIDEAGVFSGDFRVKALKAPGKKCSRCWNYSEKVGSFEDHPELCERCRPIVGAL